MPFDEVDVNVHPGKKEVRFAEKKLLNGLIYSAIKKAVEEDEEKREDDIRFGMLFQNATRENVGPTVQKVLRAIDDGTKDVLVADSSVYRVKKMMREHDISASDLKPLGPQYRDAPTSYDDLPEEYKVFEQNLFEDERDPSEKEYVVPSNVPDEKLLEGLSPGLVGRIMRKPSDATTAKEEKYHVAYVDENEEQQEIQTLYGEGKGGDLISPEEEELRRTYRIVGQVFDTYFIIESGKQLFFVDQHAAHERILYDKLLQEVDRYKRVQAFLVPYYTPMSEEDMEVFRENEENLLSLGFELCFRENGLEILSVPNMLTDINLDEFVYSVLSGKADIKKLNDIAKIKDRFAKYACRSAIKGGMRLTDEEVEYVMDYFFTNGMPLQCPHGRPTVVIVNKSEMEKWFKRIV